MLPRSLNAKDVTKILVLNKKEKSMHSNVKFYAPSGTLTGF